MNRLFLRIGLTFLAAGILVLGISKTRSTVDSNTARIDYGSVPDFSLSESSGRTVQLKDLRGQAWIADFIFTSCAGTCPAMSSQMRKLRDALPGGIRFVSF